MRTEPNLLSVTEALKTLLSDAQPVVETQNLALNACAGRIVAQDQEASIAVPGFDNSAMDGYALRSAEAGGALLVTQRICAGEVGRELQAGTAARIFTGAALPVGADAVVMQEHCHEQNGVLRIHNTVNPGAHIRRTGEDIAIHSRVLCQGEKLTPQALGLAASVGISVLPVLRRLKVAVFFSGNELLEPGEALQTGKIYNTNRYTLPALLRALDCEVIDLGNVADNLKATETTLLRGAEQADMILASGGVSVGEEDYVRHALENLGRLDVWRIAIKPGKPLAFGKLNNTPFLGLPGNPVSVFVTFCILARPFILRSQGATQIAAPCFRVGAGFVCPADRRESYYRARLEIGEDTRAVLYSNQGSGVLTSVHWADGLLKVPAGQAVSEGDRMDFYPYHGLLA